MRARLALLLPAVLSAGCATAPTRWAGGSSVVLDPAPVSNASTDEAQSGPDCSALGVSAPSDAAAGEAGKVKAQPPILWVTSIARPVPPPPGEVLPDRTGAAFYEQIGRHTDSLDKFMSAVRPPKPLSDVIDLTHITRTLTLAVHRQGFRPADRYERVQVIVKAVNFRFADPQPSETTFDVADLGHLTEQTQASGTAALTASPNASASVGLTRSQTYDRDLRRRFQDEDVIVAPRTLRVYREGAPGRDLTGALPLPITAEPPRPEDTVSQRVVTGVRLKAGSEKGGVDTAMLKTLGARGAPAAPLYACARLRYLERRVIVGQRYLDEARQRVEIAAGDTPWRAYEIVSAEEVRPPLWQLTTGAAPVQLERDGRRASEFLDVADAQKLATWLAAPGTEQLGPWRIGVGGRGLSPAQRAGLRVTRMVEGAPSRPVIDPALVEVSRPQATAGPLE